MLPGLITLAGGVVLLLATVLLLMSSRPKQAGVMRARLETMTALPAASVMTRDAQAVEKTPLLDYLPAGLQAYFRQQFLLAGNSVTLTRLLLVSVVTVGIVFMLFFIVLRWSFELVSGTALFFALVMPYFYLSAAIQSHRGRFLHLFPDAIELIVRAVRAGLPVAGAMEGVSKEIADPVGSEFRKIVDDMRIGIDFDDALRRAALRVQILDFNFFVAALILQHETGGNLSETLATLANVLRRRSEMRAKAKALTSEARISAIVIGALPFVAAAAMAVFSPDYIAVLFTDPMGTKLLGSGLLCLVLAGLTMRWLIQRALR